MYVHVQSCTFIVIYMQDLCRDIECTCICELLCANTCVLTACHEVHEVMDQGTDTKEEKTAAITENTDKETSLKA